MKNPGIYDLGDLQITAAVADSVMTRSANAQGAAIEYLRDLQGMTGLTLSCEMKGGTGGTSIDVVVQTSIDQGNNWLDIARFTFANTAAIKVCNLTGLLAKAVAAYAALGAEGVNDGLLGDRLRAKVTSVGTYSGTTVSVRAAAR